VLQAANIPHSNRNAKRFVGRTRGLHGHFYRGPATWKLADPEEWILWTAQQWAERLSGPAHNPQGIGAVLRPILPTTLERGAKAPRRRGLLVAGFFGDHHG